MSARDGIHRHLTGTSLCPPPRSPEEASGLIDAHRAEVLREAQAEVVSWLLKKAREYQAASRKQVREQGDVIGLLASKVDRGAVRLFLTAAEAGKDTQPGESTQPAELTIYRASHDSIVMGLYTTREAAREQCETLTRREVGDTALLGWVPDDGSEHAPEELCTGEDVECTGYVVTPLTVASAYDEEADE